MATFTRYRRRLFGGRMNFLEAVKEMKQGNKVARDIWGYEYPGAYWYMDSSRNIKRHFHYNDNIINTFIGHFEAIDWKVVEEKKMEESADGLPLSQKKRQLRFSNEWGLLDKDVKEAITKFIEKIKIMSCYRKDDDIVDEKAKEIFGDDLL